MKVWEVTIEDLSHLGGPMGTEYITVINTKLFGTRAAAIKWIKKRPAFKWFTKDKFKSTDDYWDCAYEGYRLRAKEVL